MSKTYFDIAPTNNASYFSWTSGVPQMIFNLSNTSALITKMKLQGEIVICNSAGAVISNPVGAYQMNNRTGAGSVVQMMTVASNKLNQQLEQVRQMHRLNTSLNCAMNSNEDFVNSLSHELAPNSDRAQTRTITSGANALTDPTHRCHFSIELNSGIIQSLIAQGGVYLGEELFGGLVLTLELNNSKTALFGADANTGDYEVRIYNPRLRGSYIRGLPAELMGVSKVKEFYTWSNFYNVINSNTEQVNINLGLSSVVSSFTNFIQTARTNSYLYDACRTPNLVGEQKVIYSKAGRRHPYNFPIQATPKSAEGPLDNPPVAPLTQDYNRTHCNQICRNFTSAFEKYVEREREASLIDYEHQTIPTDRQPRCAGIGCRFDVVSGVGETFQNVSLEFTIDSDLGVASSTPMALFTYVLNRNMIQASSQQVGLSR